MAFRRSRVMRLLLGGVVLVILGAGAAAVAFHLAFLRDLPDFRTLEDYRPALTTTVLDRNGIPIAEFYEYRRRVIPLSEVPELVIHAFLAAEDDAFYEHSGVDYLSIVRAAWANLRAGGETRQGASTITQQVVKQLLLSPERTYRRKIRELILARRIEERFSKEEILFLYLNQIYFGSGAYGVSEAAYTYFGKKVADLDAAEAALLAGLPKAPSRYSPFLHPVRGEERRLYVLNRMHEEGFIDEATHAESVAEPLALQPPLEREAYETAAYFTEEVRKSLFDRLGSDLVLRGGLTVETSLDLQLQKAAVEALAEGLENLDHRQGYRGPVRRVEPGEIEDERARLAEENRLQPDEEELPDEEESPAEIPLDRPLLGVVLSVDAKNDSARVAFAPEIEASVVLDDVKWARPANPTSYPWEVKSIEKVFAVGDVAWFIRESNSSAPEEGDAALETRVILDQEPEVQGALLSFDVNNGDVLALAGGRDFDESEFNRVTQARRQPGSAFKPIIYAAALGRDLTPASIIYDSPVVYDDPESGLTWRPENYGRRFLGRLTMSEALARSINNATIHLLENVGIDYAMDFARRLGIEAPLERNLGLALGTNPVSLLELTRAYAVFPAGGREVKPRFVYRVTDPEGNLLLEDLLLGEPFEPEAGATAEEGGENESGEDEVPSPPPANVEADPEALPPGQLIARTHAYLATDLLRGVVNHPLGTGRKARVLGRPVAGKTGTTNDQGDAWFIGFSPDVATGVWVGYDEKRVLGRGETGGRAALPIWIDFMDVALGGRPPRDFEVPDGIVFARVDTKTGLLASSQTETSLFQAFLEGTEPSEQAAAKTSTADERRHLRLDF
jgi:penicillin-binding protein 1A